MMQPQLRRTVYLQKKTSQDDIYYDEVETSTILKQATPRQGAVQYSYIKTIGALKEPTSRVIVVYGGPYLLRTRKGHIPDASDATGLSQFLQRLHVSGCHMNKADMIQALKDMNAPPAAIRAAKQHRCAICEADRRLKTHAQTSLPLRARYFNHTVYLDVANIKLDRADNPAGVDRSIRSSSLSCSRSRSSTPKRDVGITLGQLWDNSTIICIRILLATWRHRSLLDDSPKNLQGHVERIRRMAFSNSSTNTRSCL